MRWSRRLGLPVIQYLAAAGIGHLTIIDDDDVEISNLQRQTIHRTGDVGTSKSESAKRFVTDLDPNVSVTALYSRLTSENILKVFENHDLVIDGTDNIATRYLIDDSSKKSKFRGFMALSIDLKVRFQYSTIPMAPVTEICFLTLLPNTCYLLVLKQGYSAFFQA